MRNPCFACGRHYPGLSWFIPDEAWKAIAGKLGAGEMCPWCAEHRLKAAGIQARAQVHLDMDHFHAPNWKVISELESLDGRVMREAKP